ncbi:hypothetical protein CSKR_105790 [Clonorchis sinensis]|uniref:Uncharacterized protein n=1 Tax=Clonorchis sinensis TaxID=79923 RepID=A0A419PVE0_CLOSI|nr:hypothetical protein CSKR_105790 [Clonorchis sinensis]
MNSFSKFCVKQRRNVSPNQRDEFLLYPKNWLLNSGPCAFFGAIYFMLRRCLNGEQLRSEGRLAFTRLEDERISCQKSCQLNNQVNYENSYQFVYSSSVDQRLILPAPKLVKGCTSRIEVNHGSRKDIRCSVHVLLLFDPERLVSDRTLAQVDMWRFQFESSIPLNSISDPATSHQSTPAGEIKSITSCFKHREPENFGNIVDDWYPACFDWLLIWRLDCIRFTINRGNLINTRSSPSNALMTFPRLIIRLQGSRTDQQSTSRVTKLLALFDD